MLFAVRGAGGKPSIDTHVDMVSSRTLRSSHDLGNTCRYRLSLRHGNHDVRVQPLI
jgi:hypothetical protein